MPNAAKAESIEALKGRLDGVETAVLTEYRGLTVRQLAELRKQLKGASAEYKVLKNRLARLALRGSPLDPLGAHLKGPTGLAYTRRDPVAVAKALQAFVRANPALTIKVGLVEGKVVPPEGLRSLADLPSREVLRSQIVGAIEGPMAQLVSLLQAPMRELVYVLEQRGAGRGGAEGEPSEHAGRGGAEGEPSEHAGRGAAEGEPSEHGNAVEASGAER